MLKTRLRFPSTESKRGTNRAHIWETYAYMT